MRLICWLALPAGLFLSGLNLAAAQGSDAARQACTPDAMRLCSQFIPNAAKVKSCMLRKRSQLSEACRLAMAGGRHERHRYVRHHYYHHYVHHYRHHYVHHYYHRHYKHHRHR